MQILVRNLRTWLFQLRGPQQGEVVLVQRRIFILPSRAGVFYAVVLLLMLTGSINYTLSLGFILTFLLASLAITAMLHTFRNLVGLRISAGRAPAVFAGENARFTVSLHNPTSAARYSIALTRGGSEVDVVDVPAAASAFATAAIPAPRRGLLRPGRLTLYTRFPVGLFYAWSYLEFDMHCVVYPRPATPGLPLPPLKSSGSEGASAGHGGDDFAGLRQYHPGDSPRHIAWKAAAREQVLLTKQFSGHAHVELWLTADLLPAHLDFEEKLSYLTRWVLDAHAAGIAYGVELGSANVPIGSGDAHRDRCLEKLALA
jgi:uncharacterized protein (DUF58 family)